MKVDVAGDRLQTIAVGREDHGVHDDPAQIDDGCFEAIEGGRSAVGLPKALHAFERMPTSRSPTIDKIAFFLNRYLNLGTDDNHVYFARIWYEGESPKKPLKAAFESYANLPLRGLYWLSRDFDDRADRQLAPDAVLLNTVRQHLEHKYLKLHTDDWTPTATGEFFTDTLAHSIRQPEFQRKALRLARLTRAAMIYLILGVHVEERHRKEKRGDERIIGMPLDRYEDEWKS